MLRRAFPGSFTILRLWVRDIDNNPQGGTMTNKMQLQGQWQRAKGRVKEAWGDLSDDDIDKTEGNWDQLVGKIREKTGETTEAIETKMGEILDSVSNAAKSNS
jgi:uncharacterized protein YjbJ (UPF0337 family)